MWRLRLHGTSRRGLTGPVPPGRRAGRAPERQPGLLPQRSAVPGGPRLHLQPGPGPLQAGRGGRGGRGTVAVTRVGWWAGWVEPVKVAHWFPSPTGVHTAAVGPQPRVAADAAHGLHPHPVQPRALCDPQPPLLPPVAPGVAVALCILHHLPGALALLLALSLDLPPPTFNPLFPHLPISEWAAAQVVRPFTSDPTLGNFLCGSGEPTSYFSSLNPNFRLGFHVVFF